jgi:hypothetical protein
MNGGDLVVVALVLVLGCAAFFIGVIYLACGFFAFLGKSVMRLVRPPRTLIGSPGRRICPRPGCGAVEHRAARFCSQCGARFESSGLR